MDNNSALQGFSPPTAFIQNVGDKFLDGDKYYYFEVSRADWNNGEWHRIRMKASRARRIAKQIDTGVKLSSDQSKD